MLEEIHIEDDINGLRIEMSPSNAIRNIKIKQNLGIELNKIGMEMKYKKDDLSPIDNLGGKSRLENLDVDML